MRKLSRNGLANLLRATCLLFATSPSQPAAFAQTATARTAPEAGVLCVWAILGMVAEIGRRCHPGQNTDFQAELESALSRIEAYAIANSIPALTPEDVEQFKRQQSGVGRPQQAVCQPDSEGMYLHMIEGGAASIRATVDALLAQPAQPTWGECL